MEQTYSLTTVRSFCKGDEVMMRKLNKEFSDLITLSIQGIERASRREDTEALARILHRLKPIAMIYEAADSLLLIERMEGGLDGQKFTETLADLCSRLNTNLAITREQLNSF